MPAETRLTALYLGRDFDRVMNVAMRVDHGQLWRMRLGGREA
jgi:hypothetical protein